MVEGSLSAACERSGPSPGRRRRRVIELVAISGRRCPSWHSSLCLRSGQPPRDVRSSAHEGAAGGPRSVHVFRTTDWSSCKVRLPMRAELAEVGLDNLGDPPAPLSQGPARRASQGSSQPERSR